jgi:hypothetical protein
MYSSSFDNMYFLASKFNYFTLEGIPWLALAWVSVFSFRSIATWIHEIGHLLPTYFFTQGLIEVSVGDGFFYQKKVGRCTFNFSFKSPMAGYVSYQKQDLSRKKRILILLGGPLASSTALFTTFYVVNAFDLVQWIEVLCAGFLCANLLCFLRSILPLKLQASSAFPQGIPSDSLQVLQLAKEK